VSFVSPHRVRRYGHASAVGLLAAGVLAGGLTGAAPAIAAPPPPDVVETTAATAAKPAKPALIRTRSHVRASRSTVVKGHYVRVRGKVTYGATTVRRGIVRLQVRSGSAWKNSKSMRIPARGIVTFTVRPGRTHHFRLSYPGGHLLARSASRSIRIVVKKPRITSASRSRARVMAVARSLSGRPYVFGAAGPRAFDCSGYTKYVFRKVRVSLPHKADLQKRRGVRVARGAARPGDLVLFLSGGHAYHVGIYAGGRYMYDSPRPGLSVGKHTIWSRNVIFRRVI